MVATSQLTAMASQAGRPNGPRDVEQEGRQHACGDSHAIMRECAGAGASRPDEAQRKRASATAREGQALKADRAREAGQAFRRASPHGACDPPRRSRHHRQRQRDLHIVISIRPGL